MSTSHSNHFTFELITNCLMGSFKPDTRSNTNSFIQKKTCNQRILEDDDNDDKSVHIFLKNLSFLIKKRFLFLFWIKLKELITNLKH